MADPSAVAREFREQSGWGLGGCDSLAKLVTAAIHLGALVEESPNPGESGRAYFDGHVWRIWLSPTENIRRTRFTLAHEIGHVLIGQRQLRVSDEERWCDDFAGELVAPAHLIEDLVASGLFGFELIDTVAERFRLTRTCAVMRVNGSSREAFAMVTFWRNDERWVIHHTLGVPRHIKYRIATCELTAKTLDCLRPSSRPVSLPGFPLLVQGSLRHLNGTVVRSLNFSHLLTDRSELSEPTNPFRSKSQESLRAIVVAGEGAT